MKEVLSIARTAGISFRVRLIVPTVLLSFALSVRARLADVKKLSVVTFLPLFKYGDMSRITTLSGSDSLAERSSSFPKYGKALHRYLVSLSTNIQNFIPNLSGLFAMYWVNLHLALDGKSCSSAVRFSPGL